MRSEQFVAAFGVSAVAAAGAGLNDASIVSRFRLSGHPTLQAWLTAEVARLGPNARVKLGMGSSYRCIRQVFYHCNLFSCFSKTSVHYVDGHLKRLKAATKKAKHAFEKSTVHSTGLPLPADASPSLEDMVELLLVKFAMVHAQATVDTSNVIIFSKIAVRAAKLTGLLQMGPVIKFEAPHPADASLDAEHDHGLVSDDHDYSDMLADSEDTVFKVVNNHAKRSRADTTAI